jgi:hypothetical protein
VDAGAERIALTAVIVSDLIRRAVRSNRIL